MCASRLSIRRDGPERAEEKKSRRVRLSFVKAAARSFPPRVDAKHDRGRRRATTVSAPMGEWYTIGILVGLGVSFGILVAAFVPRFVIAALLAVAAGVLVGFLVFEWDEAIGGAVGGVLGALGATPIVAGALRRGGTRGGTAALVAVGALAAAALAFVPVVGYLEAVALPALGLRLRRREPDRHAGLRTLARD